jgi:DNA-binding transcriptional LysR family regulator
MAGPMSKTEELRAFCAVASSGGFTSAARSLGLTTSSISKQVRALESSLGVRLLNRTTRRVSLTEAGTRFYERAEEVLERLAEAEEAAGEVQTTPRGTLRATIPMDFGRTHMSSILSDFCKRFPEVSLDIDLTDRHVDLIGEGFDVGVRIGALADSGLIARRIAPSRMILVASPDYVARCGAPQEPKELKAHACFAYTLKASPSWEFQGTQVSITPRHRVNNGDMIRSLVLDGHGIALLPTFIVGRDVVAGRLRHLLAGRVSPPQSIFAVYPHRRSITAKVRAFVDTLSDYCGDAPPWDDGLSAEP